MPEIPDNSPKACSSQSTTTMTTTMFRMFFDLAVHRNVVVDEPQQHADDDQNQNDRNE